MSRKDYQFFAQWSVDYGIIKDHEAMEVLISYLEEQNSRFNRDTFFEATERLSNGK